MAVLLKPEQNTTDLSDADIAQAQAEYWELFTSTETTPRGVWDTENLDQVRFRQIDSSYIEIADFFLSDGTLEGFKRTGLGVITAVNASECVKYLLSFPGQVLPWHAHISVAVAPKGFAIPNGFRNLSDLVPGFQGDPDYGADAMYFVPKDFEKRANFDLKPEWKEQGVAYLQGKEETFTVLAGTLEAYGPGDGVAASQMPEDHRQFVTQRSFDLRPGDSFHIPCNRPHLCIGGPAGCVYLESSTRSRDCLDYFFNKDIYRLK